MISRVYSEISQAVSAMKRSANDIIDSQNSENEWSKRLNYRFSKIGSQLEESLKEIYCDSRMAFQDKVEEKRKDVDKILYKSIVIPEIEITISIDISKVIDCLKLHVKEDIFKAFVEGFNPFKVFDIFRKDHREDGRLEAKRELRNILHSFEQKLREETDYENENFKKHLSAEVRRMVKRIDDELNNIKYLRTYLEELSVKF